MIYRNTSGDILSGNPAVAPYGLTSDLTPQDIEESSQLRYFIANGILVEHKGPAPKPAPKPADARYIVDTPKKDKPVVNPTTKQVAYIVTDTTDNLDMIHTSDPDMQIAKDPNNQSVDLIEDAFDASKMKTASQIMEEQLNQDDALSTFDDEETLADQEGEETGSEDVDDFLRKDAASFIKNNGKAGAKTETVANMVKDDLEQAVADMNNAVSNASDDGETATTGTGKAVDFLKQPFFSKKKIIARETDKAFLGEIGATTNSENIKKLVSQRLSELG